ncbi:endonuclease [Dyadobacter sp. CY261]|uniref:DNA-formamidopyrimidine glycosylase family protein n=1 Tax=Dyadobacter sp. CY261 TaxID=2907203 RepID=UPI001F2F253B|nr:DNA-formamidopyrimidine glycosylase family protein [Dyadobacter sp. CY261]MCF0068886.1 endonuclease [Dyadobacter sp. CY261]
MPEGPSIVILREAIEDLGLKGKPVRHVEGNAKIDKDSLINQKVTDFRSWGKHFLICFKDFTVRIHFMLFGSYLIDDQKKTKPMLSLIFDKHELNFYTSSIKLFDKPAEELYDWSADIMSKSWQSTAAFKKLKENPKMLACDALLDQNIFAGSGNIIKNEVLFRCRIHPLSKIAEIPDAKLKEMIKETRNYAFDFLEWKKEGTLKRHWLAHTKKICPRCEIPFHKEYLGRTKRRSYYCESCQRLYD